MSLDDLVESLNAFLEFDFDHEIEDHKQTPESLKHAIYQMDYVWKEDSDKTKFLNTLESELVKYHHGLGRWIRNNWELWPNEKNQLIRDFERLGIEHVDDMSSIIILSYHRMKNGKELGLNDQVQQKIDHWEQHNN